jgi:hypothetical protein
MPESSNERAVGMTLVGRRRGRPPVVILLFDLTLHNQSVDPRWFALPAWIDSPWKPRKGGVDGIEVFSAPGKQPVVLGRFLGTGRFQALRLAGGARVQLRRFSISFWEEEPAKGALAVELVIARRITVGGEPAEAWFGVDPMIEDGAEGIADEAAIIAARQTPDHKEVAVSMEEDSRVTVWVDVTKVGP